ncbi:MAG: PKD domain-containing protein [Planctomycetota bacterium]
MVVSSIVKRMARQLSRKVMQCVTVIGNYSVERVDQFTKRCRFAAVLLAVMMVALPVIAEERVTISGSTRPIKAGMAVRGAITADEMASTMRFSVSLKMRNFEQLQARVARGEQIKPAELAAKYYPLAADHKAVCDWLVSQGFELTENDPSHISIFAKGTANQIQKAMQVSFTKAADAKKTYMSVTSDPSLPATIAGLVLGVNGLQPHNHMKVGPGIANAKNKKPMTANAAPFFPSEILKAYGYTGLTLTGAGQTIGIVIDAAPNTADLVLFWTQAGVPQNLNNISFIKVATGPNTAPSGEESLDTEWASGIAPNAKVRVYISDDLSDPNLDLCYARILQDIPSTPGMNQISLSYGLSEDDTAKQQMITDAQYFASMASQGVTVFVSSGDDGSYPPDSFSLAVASPSNDPSVTSVGGTSIVLNTVTGLVQSEAAWNGSGGGTSKVFLRPSWQTGSGVPSGTYRLNPDVSAPGDSLTGALVVLNGQSMTIGGTSWSAPTWAGFAALLNEARTNANLPPLGLLGPKIYPLIGTAAFRDITVGSNGAYNAGPNYDLVTGIGVPNLANLLTSLTPSVTPPVINSQNNVAGNNVNVDPSAVTHHSSCVAINPANPKNAVCFSALAQNNGGLAVGVSSTRGVSWVHRHIADGSDAFPVAGGSPSCAFDDFGNLYLAYANNGNTQIVVLMSTDGGNSFTLAGSFSGTNLGQPRITAGPDTFTSTNGGQAVWVGYYDGTNGSIFVSGAPILSLGPVLPLAFTNPLGVTGTDVSVVGDLAVDPDGQVVISFQKADQIFTSVDQDGLGTQANFSNPNLVNFTNVLDGNTYPAQAAIGINASPGLAFDRSGGLFNYRLYIVYVTELSVGNDDTNVVVCYSDNHGLSPWSTEKIVNDGTLKTDGSETTTQFFPRIAVDQVTGYVAVSYYDCRNDFGQGGAGDTNFIYNDDTQFYANISFNGGASFNPEIDLSPVGAVEIGTTVTITTLQPHGFSVGTLVEIQGVEVFEYNGSFTITSVPSTTTFTYTLTVTGLAASGSLDTSNYAIAAQPIRLSKGTSNAESSNAKSPFAVDFGDYSGLAFVNGAFISSWSDNSNSTNDNPSGNLGNLQLYTNTTTVTPNPGTPATGASKPDLRVFRINIPVKPVAGHPFKVVATIFNAGGSDAGPFTVSAFSAPAFVGFQDSTQSDFSVTDPSTLKRVDNQAVLGLKSGATINVNLTMEYDYAGDQIVAVLVDSQRNITETNELNNLLTQRLLVLSPGKDIAVREWLDPITLQDYPQFVTSGPGNGIDAHFDFTLVNLGTRNTGNFTVGVYYNRATPPLPTDTPDTTIAIASMAPGTFSAQAFDLPTQTTPRGGRAWIFANYAGVTTELVTTNNVASAVWGIQNTPPVINPSIPLTATPSTADVGDKVTFTVAAMDDNGDPLFYTWNFGDGTFASTTVPTVTHIYAAQGTYVATVTVSDGPFSNVTSTATVTIFDAQKLDLGFVISNTGYIKLQVPSPFGSSKATILTLTQNATDVTVTTAQPHGYLVGQPVTISKASVRGYNGLSVILSVPSPTTFTIAKKPGLSNAVGGIVTPLRMSIKTNIIQTSPIGQNVAFKNQILSGIPGGPNTYTFTIEYIVAKYHLVQRIRYSYTVKTNP